MEADQPLRWWRRWTFGVAGYLMTVPLLLLAVELGLPGDHVVTATVGSPEVPGALPLAQGGPDSPVRAGEVLLAVDGRPVADLLTDVAHPAVHPVRVGDRHVYRIRAADGRVTDRPVTVRAGRDLWAAVRHNQPDAVLASLAVLALGGWLVRRRPGERAALALLLYGAGWTSAGLADWATPEVLDYAARPWLVAWWTLSLGGYLVSGVATLLFAMTFPASARRLRSPAWPALAVLPVALTVGLAVLPAVGLGASTGMGVANAVAEVSWQALTLAALLTVGVRWTRLRHDPVARRRIQVVVMGFAGTFGLALFGKWASVPPGTFGFGLVLLVFPVSVAVAIAARDLYDLDVVVNRTLVALVTGGLLLGVYLAVTAATVRLVDDRGPLVALPAAGLVAVALAPVRARVQRLVAARLFGTGGDTQQVLHRLGVRLEASADPEQLISAVVDTAAEGLRLPYVAVELEAADTLLVVRDRGRRPSGVERFPITVGDRTVGALVAAPRREAAGLSPVDRLLLADLARHCGVAARVVGLLTELRQAQQVVLVAREQERNRIHRDLHDGLGPSLVGLTLQLEVAAELAASSSGELATLLDRLHREAGRAAGDVRRLVRDLRPAELAELGLPAAVMAAADRLQATHGPRFAVTSTAGLARPSARVEDVAYKIALEAMTNVLRHSQARTCRVRLGMVDGHLELDIRDDGIGLGGAAPRQRSGGTGLLSMQERARSVGGELRLESDEGAGTRVLVRLPTATTAVPPLAATGGPVPG